MLGDFGMTVTVVDLLLEVSFLAVENHLVESRYDGPDLY